MKSVLSTAVLVITIISVSSGLNNKCVRETDGATFKHPESEQLYFICFKGEMVEVKCRDNYYFNEENGKCVLTIDGPGENPTTFNACANVEGIAIIPSETSCQHFHICIYGQQSDGVCPDNQLFDSFLLSCYNAEDVNCNPWTTTESTTLVETTSTTEIFTTTTEKETTESTTTENTTTENTTADDTTTEGTTANEQTAEISVTTTTIFETTELTEEIIPEISTVTTEQTTIGTTRDYPTTPPSVTTTSPESVCYQIPDTHLVNDPASCDAFFVCFYEIPIPGICPAPLFFNPDKSECDYPENVICYDATEPTTQAPNFCDGIPNGKLFDNPESCSHFFICINNEPQPGVCPLGLYFNDVSRSCDSPENVNCFSSTITTEIPTVPTTEATTTTGEPPSDACIGIKDGTLVNNPRYCDAFFLCFGENAIEGTCPPPSLFNSKLGICDLPENVDCDIETTTALIETTTKPVDICYGLADLTFLNDPRKCADYFICFNDQSLPQSCPGGFYFDPSISICARSETVDCDNNESTTTEVPSTTGEASTTERSTTTEDEITTTEESTTTTEEPTTLTEEPTTTMEESTTYDRTTTTEETSTDQPIPENCPSTGVQAIPNPHRCSRFRLCASGLEFELACPPDEHFVFAQAACLPREIANCTIPIPVCDPIASAQIILILPHPHYCDQFFLCFTGLLTPFKCAEGQHFDIVSEECTSTAIANCEVQ